MPGSPVSTCSGQRTRNRTEIPDGGQRDRRARRGAVTADRRNQPEEGGNRPMATNAYCVKCKAKRDMQNEQKITMKNGKPATEGKCPVCGTKMFRIGA